MHLKHSCTVTLLYVHFSRSAMFVLTNGISNCCPLRIHTWYSRWESWNLQLNIPSLPSASREKTFDHSDSSPSFTIRTLACGERERGGKGRERAGEVEGEGKGGGGRRGGEDGEGERRTENERGRRGRRGRI